MKNEEIDKLVSEKVHSTIESLKSKGARSLRELPAESIEELEVGDKKLTFCVYRDQLQNSETLIIAQCKNTRFLGYGKMFAEGIVVNEAGNIRDAEEKLLWEYV
jgi:hypothetical protein